LQCARTLLDSWKARVSERSRSRERRMVLAREHEGRAREYKKQGMAQRWMSIGQIQDSPRDARASSSGNLKGSADNRAGSKEHN
jgi:hypothetical protein